MRISDWSSDVCSSDLATLSARFDRGDGFIPIVEESRGLVDRPASYRQWSTRARAVVPVGEQTELQASAGLFGDDRDRGTAYTGNSTLGAETSIRLISHGDWRSEEGRGGQGCGSTGRSRGAP